MVVDYFEALSSIAKCLVLIHCGINIGCFVVRLEYTVSALVFALVFTSIRHKCYPNYSG